MKDTDRQFAEQIQRTSHTEERYARMRCQGMSPTEIARSERITIGQAKGALVRFFHKMGITDLGLAQSAKISYACYMLGRYDLLEEARVARFKRITQQREAA